MDHKVQNIMPNNYTPPGTGDVNTWAPTNRKVAGHWRSNRSITTSATLVANATKWHELNYFLRATSFDV